MSRTYSAQNRSHMKTPGTPRAELFRAFSPHKAPKARAITARGNALSLIRKSPGAARVVRSHFNQVGRGCARALISAGGGGAEPRGRHAEPSGREPYRFAFTAGEAPRDGSRPGRFPCRQRQLRAARRSDAGPHEVGSGAASPHLVLSWPAARNYRRGDYLCIRLRAQALGCVMLWS